MFGDVRRPRWDRVVSLGMGCLYTLGVAGMSVAAQNSILDPLEITNEEYRRFILATGYPKPEHWPNGTYVRGTGPEPVTLVTWHDAVAYCQWAGGKRLPSVAEWQGKCTAGKLQKRSDIWEWTNTEAGTDDGSFKALCGPMGSCDCSHQYRPHWKNEVKGFRCALDATPVAGKNFEFRIANFGMKK